MAEKTYRPAEIETPAFTAAVEAAKGIWKKSCEAHFAKHGDSGTCVMGAGIYIDLIPRRCRKPQKYFIIRANEVSCCQGSTNWEYGRQEVLDYLKAHGIEARYEWGIVD
jgi:hypothetical protein